MIGEFKLRGTIAEAGKVNLVKQYVGMHAVDYVGTYDGEGLMWGQWWIGSLNNRWLIKIKRSKAAPSDATDIETIV